MKLYDHIALWNHASLKVLDIRHGLLETGMEMQSYRLPVSAFLYVQRGNASVRMDDVLHTMSRNHVLHGGRGARLNILAEEAFEYYLVLYKAVLMLPASKKLMLQLERDNPFLYQYSFVPLYPLPLRRKLEEMMANWMGQDPLNSFHARSLLYQFVHELLSQINTQGIHPVHPDLLAQVVRYIQDHYMEPITLDILAEEFDCSVSYLSKLFKQRMNESPIRFLTRIRMERTVNDLLQTDLSLQEIAERVGYPDAHTLSRSFKKIYGLPPMQFKTRVQAGSPVPEMPVSNTKSALVAVESRCYSFNGYENDYHLDKRGGYPLHKVTKSTSMATAALLLCFMLFISACSSTSNTVNNNTAANRAQSTATSQETTKENSSTGNAVATTKTYTDAKGTVTIPTDPKRIVDLTGSAIGNLLTLGVKPVAATQDSLANPYHEGKLDGIINIGEEPNIEAILALEPDLIIAFDYIEEAQYEQLAQVAPVIRLKYGAGTPSELLMEFGKITGKEDLAQEWAEKWKAKIAEVKPKITEVVGDKTVSILQPFAKGIYAWGNKGGRGGEILYDDLGLKAPEVIQKALIDGPEFGTDLSLELLPQYAGDYIFTSNWGWDDGNANVVYDSKLWKSLPAVKNSQVYFISEKGSYYNDPISLEAQLDLIVTSFLGK
ncbi:AraC family transcriptional regulator [Paenibacillus sp. NPDC058177]|uniref:AraC family transcriptional regulator n=1 Tax=Paenibacillus sp. NPDC058177 TaxID=3346369 RepID=UPI0036DF204B